MMVAALRGRVSKLKNTFLNISDLFPQLYHQSRSLPVVPPLMRVRSFSSMDMDDEPPSLSGRGTSKRPFPQSSNGVGANSSYQKEDSERMYDKGAPQKNPPPDPIPNRPLRAEKPIYQLEQQQRLSRGGGRMDFDNGGYAFNENKLASNYKSAKVVGSRTRQQSRSNIAPPQPFVAGEKQGGSDFLDKFKLGFDKGDKQLPLSKAENHQTLPEPQLPPPQDADEIFKKMKETGLIPNAVAMLHGLCQDGLVQEAMKLFGLMREKGTIPEVVIYTAVVEGFCKAQKLDDAKRIFRKMQNNGISPNAFSYAILIQGLYQSKSLDDALDFCVEMLEAGHSPNLATFTGLVDRFCREKGLEEAQSIIGTLRQKGFFFDEKTVREYLDKKGPFLPLVWEAILGKKSSQKSF